MRFDELRRREFIWSFVTLAGAAAAAWPLAARAQEPGRIYRLGAVFASPREAPHHVAFFAELRRLGFIEGQNLAVDARGYGLRVDQMDEHAAEGVESRVDVIMVGGDAHPSTLSRHNEPTARGAAARHQANRLAGRAADAVRAGHQSSHRAGDRPRHSGWSRAARRQSGRVSDVYLWISTLLLYPMLPPPVASGL